MNPYDIIYHFYPHDTALRRLLILHSEKVRDKAFAILEEARRNNPSTDLLCIDEQLVNDGALLHDLGIGRTYGPGIHCEGNEPYICHGIIGARMLRDLIDENRCLKFSVAPERLEQIARICERHTGAGLSMRDIVNQNLLITPPRDLVPETLEEKLVCLADKFYSKSGDPSKEKDLERVKRSLMKFGADSTARFEELCRLFSVNLG